MHYWMTLPSAIAILYVCACDFSVDQLVSENHQQVSDLQIKLGDQENTLWTQKNEIKQLLGKLDEKEAQIKELFLTVEAKDKLLTETLKSTETQNNDIQVLHAPGSTESSIDVNAETSTKVDAKVSVRSIACYHAPAASSYIIS